MRISTIVFVSVLLTCWALTFTWARKWEKNNNDDDPPILLGTLPDLPPIVLPSMASQLEKNLSEMKTPPPPAEAGSDDGDTESEPESQSQRETLEKLDRLKFTPAPNPTVSIATPGNFDFRDVPMFTPRDALFPKS